jgi:hypothetical protein
VGTKREVLTEKFATKETKMNFCKWASVLLLSATVWAQTAPAPTAKKTVKKTAAKKAVVVAAPAATAAEVKELRDALAAQQQQIEQMRNELQQRTAASQTQVQQAQAQAAAAENKAAEAQAALDQQKENVTKLSADVTDLKGNLTSTATQMQDDQQKVSALEGLASRFRWSGDVRVRQEDFFQSYAACTNCGPRIRERIRIRFGFEGKLNDDFIAGAFLASGIVTDPTSTNETLSGSFERKNISLDRGYIIYQPQAHKWLQLTGGKFAYTWIRTPATFDSDLNPEGFSEKFSFDTKGKFVKNVTFTGMQLLYNEVNRKASASTCPAGSTDPNAMFCQNGSNTHGADSYAVGGQVSAKLQLGKRVTFTPAYSLLNWRNENDLLNNPATVLPSPANASPFANGLTNATTTIVGTNGVTTTVFRSKFLYSDLILDATVNTGMAKWPWRILGEYLDNLNAVKVNPALGVQSHLYKVETYIGQQKVRNDLQFGYGFWRQEQDSVIAAFDESDQRAPTNIVQHFFTGSWLVRNNVTAAATMWYGRTLNSGLQNAVLAPGFVGGPGKVEPYLKRFQFDVVYKF